jgi:hypothetical protein
MLITYADSMGQNLIELDSLLKKHFKGIIGGVHLLPFFPSSADIDLIYKRKPRASYVEVEFADGTRKKIWCAFDAEQVALNLVY